MGILRKIAVIYGETEEISSVYTGKKLKIYSSETKETPWTACKVADLAIEAVEDIATLKKLANDLMSELEDCKIIIAKGFTGIFFQMFSQKGYYIFETENITDDILSEVYEEVFEVKKLLERGGDVPTAPIETEVPGFFAFDLQLLTEKYPEISSKKALIPFLDQENFLELALQCAHTPPWLFQRNDIKVKELKSGGKVLAIINKVDC